MFRVFSDFQQLLRRFTNDPNRTSHWYPGQLPLLDAALFQLPEELGCGALAGAVHEVEDCVMLASSTIDRPRTRGLQVRI